MSTTYQQYFFSIQSLLRGSEPSTLPVEKITRISVQRLMSGIEEICQEGLRIHSGRDLASPFGEQLSYYLVGNALVENKIRDALGDRYWTTITSEGRPNTNIIAKFIDLYGHEPEKQTITVP